MSGTVSSRRVRSEPLAVRRAAVLIIVLWAIVVLSLVCSGISFAIRQDTAVSGLERDRLTAHWLARAGAERAIAEVMEGSAAKVTAKDPSCDEPRVMKDVSLTGGTFSVIRDGHEQVPVPRYGAWDENAKLNLNTATREQLMKLPRMTAPIAGAILDWRDADNNPEQDGIEGGHYSSLAHPYKIRNGPFQTVRELLLVRGVTPELFYAEDVNLNGLLDDNENDGSTSYPPDNADGQLDRGWAAYLTIYSYEKNVNALGEKRLNINKADANTMARRLSLESWAAESIVKARERGEFKSLTALLDVKRERGTSVDASGDAEINNRGASEKDQAVTKDMLRRFIDEIAIKDDDVFPGRININTAPLEVLKTLPGIKDDMASSIVQVRESMGGCDSIGDLLGIASMGKEAFAKLENAVTVRSSVFEITSHGYASSGIAEATIYCVVDRGGDGHVPRVLYWLESTP